MANTPARYGRDSRKRKPCFFCGTLTYLVKRGTGEAICSPCMERLRAA